MLITYCPGFRPLEGFTLRQSVGCGSFGEVYFAVSDGGKKVALKLLRGAETRVNSRQPDLVHLCDLRTDRQGGRWIVIDDVYAAGVSLYEMLAGCHPFEGEPAGDASKNHRPPAADLSKIPDAWVPVVARALAQGPRGPPRHHGRTGRCLPGRGSSDRQAAPAGARTAASGRCRACSRLREPPDAPACRGWTVRLDGAGGGVRGADVAAVGGAGPFRREEGPPGRVHADHRLRVDGGRVLVGAGAARIWSGRLGKPWQRRLVMLGMGGLVGVLSLSLTARWPEGIYYIYLDDPRTWEQILPVLRSSKVHPLIYFAAAFFALRWWRMADRYRRHGSAFCPCWPP